MIFENIYPELGQKIKRYRQSKGRTQNQLSTQIGISRASLANIESGRQQVLVHHLYRIAQALNIDSLGSLLPPTKIKTPSTISSSSLPLPKKGLTKKQKLDVLRMMGDTPDKTGVQAEKRKVK